MTDPSSSHPSVAAFEALSALTERMLQSARAGDWDRLVELERECRRLAETLQATPQAPLTPEEQQRKAALIRKVLADDAEIRSLAVDWMAELERLLDTHRRARALQRVYESRERPEGS
ncbi:flagellar protein FliT [Pelomicrobium sp.]|jgi:flagellar protein FliT|uniref:flagellar protein FliT n=1 Tax=Pelomicrobium sp. TaxID=2815319 RepID=UPI002FDE04A2